MREGRSCRCALAPHNNELVAEAKPLEMTTDDLLDLSEIIIVRRGRPEDESRVVRLELAAPEIERDRASRVVELDLSSMSEMPTELLQVPRRSIGCDLGYGCHVVSPS